MRLAPFRIEHWYDRHEFTTELMLSSSDCESVSVARAARARAGGARAARRAPSRLHGGTWLRGAACSRRRVSTTVSSRPTSSRSPPRRKGSSPSRRRSSARATTRSSRRRATSRASRSPARPEPTSTSGADPTPTVGCTISWSSSGSCATTRGSCTSRRRTTRRGSRCRDPSSTASSSCVPSAAPSFSATRSTASSSTIPQSAFLPPVTSTSGRSRSGASRRRTGCPGCEPGGSPVETRSLRDALVAVKLYTTICSSAPSELLAALALRHREHLVERNLALVLANLELADAFVASHAELVDWVRPNARPDRVPAVSRAGHVCVLRAARRGGRSAPAPGRGVRRGRARALRAGPRRCGGGVRAARSPTSRRSSVEILLHEAEQDAVHPRTVRGGTPSGATPSRIQPARSACRSARSLNA